MQQRLSWQLWLLNGLILFFLSACSTSPRPSDAVVVDTNLLGIAEFSDTVSVQALVPGLSFAVVDRSVVDGDGVRVQEVVYEINNTSDRDLSNLTLYAVDTPDTLAGTNVSGLRDALGSEITDPDMAPSIVSVHGSDADNKDMQAFTEADKVRVKGLLDEMYPDNSFAVLSRGFVASNISGQADRAIAAGEQGVITIAVQYPYDTNNPAGYPDTFTLSFAFVDEPTTRFTQGDNESNEAFLDRLESYGGVPTGSEIVPADPDNAPNPSDVPTQNPNPTPNDEPTIITPAPFDPPISQAPTTPNEPTDPALPDSFTLGVASLIVSAEVEVTVSVAPAVDRTLVWE